MYVYTYIYIYIRTFKGRFQVNKTVVLGFETLHL